MTKAKTKILALTTCVLFGCDSGSSENPSDEQVDAGDQAGEGTGGDPSASTGSASTAGGGADDEGADGSAGDGDDDAGRDDPDTSAPSLDDFVG